MLKWTLCCLLSFGLLIAATAGTIYVDSNTGDDAYDGTSPTYISGSIGPKLSANGAMAVASAGDTVLLAAGTYSGSNNKAIAIKDSVTLMGVDRDAVILDISGYSFGINLIDPQGAFIKNVSIENLTIKNAKEASILAERTIDLTAKNLLLYSSGQYSTTHPNSDGIRILGSRDFLVSGIECRDMAQVAIVLGAGVFDGVIKDLNIYRVGDNLFSGGIAIWTGAGVNVPAANVNNIFFQGDITMDSVSNGFIIEAEQNLTINITASANTSFTNIPNADVLRYGAGSTPNIIAFAQGLGLPYKGFLGLVVGLQAYFTDLQDMLTLAENPLYEPNSTLMDLQEDNFYVAGEMDVALAMFRAEDDDTINFYPGTYADNITVVDNLIFRSVDPVTTLQELTLDGTDVELTLIKDFHIERFLKLDNGIINTDVNTGMLKLLESGTLLSSGVTGFINGPYQVELASSAPTNLRMPVGKDGKYHPITLVMEQSNNNLTTYTGEVIENAAPTYNEPNSISGVSPDRYWEVSSDGGAGINTLKVTISYFIGDNINDPSDLRIVQYNGAIDWLDLGGTGNNVFEGSITSDPITTLGTFTLANRVGGTNFDPNSNGSVGIVDVAWADHVKVFPNPGSDVAQLSLELTKKQLLDINLYGIDGSLLASIFNGELQLGTHQFDLALQGLASGHYHLVITGEKGMLSRVITVR